MFMQNINGICFPLKEAHDFSFLRKYGDVFCVFATNDSGNISFGTDDGKNKRFIKIAGAKTVESCVETAEAIETLKQAVPLYSELKHPGLIKIEENYQYGDLYVVVFEWADGECLFDYWNFDYYNNNPDVKPPRKRFKELPAAKKLDAFSTMFDFLTFVESKNYVAVDFYDGSIIYDFQRDTVTICDIDFFRKKPLINGMGADFWGTKRLKSPEEYIQGAVIDTLTNVFTLGALLLHFFGSYTDAEIHKIYRENTFFPCKPETWELSDQSYKIALKAVSQDRSKRYKSMEEFQETWCAAQHVIK